MKNIYMADTELKLVGTNFIFFSGMSFGLIPDDDFHTIVNHLREVHAVNWEEMAGFFVTTLTDEHYDKLPDLQVNFQKNEKESVRINFPKESYMYYVGGDGLYLFAAQANSVVLIDK